MSLGTVKDLAQLYATEASLAHGKQRWAQLQADFTKSFGQEPRFVARAPGRVNCIGEHIDYANFGVLPAALEADICCAGLAADAPDGKSKLSLHNTDASYAPYELSFHSVDEIHIDTSVHRWYNYVLAGFKAMIEHLLKKGFQTDIKPLHISLLYDGTVPAGGGLSSSAAMTCSTCTAVLASFNVVDKVSKLELTKAAIRAENLTGVSCGGMDQAASVFSTQAGLLSVEFFPELDVASLNLPKAPSASLVVANSLVVSDKKVTSKFRYNLRWVETRVACHLLAKHLGVDPSTFKTGTLKELVHVYFGNEGARMPAAKAIEQLDVMLAETQKAFGGHADGYAWSDIHSLLGTTDATFREQFHPSVEIEADKLQLLKRTLHVFAEAKRVYQYCDLLSKAESADGAQLLSQMGNLMNESQDSCREVYECSCPEIDRIVDISRPFSLGSRLTGAGWGGSTVHLVMEDKVPQFLNALRQEYYSGRSVGEVNAALFATKPSAGACIYYP